MNDYRQLILTEFIDRYENSSYYKGKRDGPRKISIVLHKRFPEYGQSFFYEITEELENISFQLKEEGLVTFSKKSIPGNREIILNQEESSIKKIYQELKRISIKEKIMNYLHQLDEYHVEGFVKDFIDEMKKKYWDARHNCSAYVIGERGQVQRCSDDGEPAQTAGRPMLDVLLGAEVKNICVVVTRYFGGTLLGTGGLVRAYSGAVQEGLKNSVIVEKCPGVELKIHTDYNGIGKIQYITAQMEIPVLDTQYTDAVDVVCMVPLEKEGSLVAQITEKTGGRAVITREKECYYGFADGELVLF